MEAKILRLLIVDDSPDEAELALTALRKGGYILKPQRINDLPALQTAVEKGGWDAVICERTLRHFGATVVIDAMKQAHPDSPVLILTRSIPDAEIATLMRAGARDVITKNQLARLLPALERELAVAAERAEHRAAIQALREIRDKHRAVVEGAREAVCYCADGMHIDANKAYLDMFGYENVAELEGVPVMNLFDKTEHARFKQYIRKGGEQAGAAQEFLAIRKNGERFSAEITLSPITINGEACTQILVSDVSKRKAVETKLQYLHEHDPLTGLYNRQHFLHTLEQAIAQAKRDDATHGVLHIDFHDLRQATKTLGPMAVDRFLLDATRKAREVFGNDTVIARYGDHEFAVYLANVASPKLRELTTTAEKMFHEGPLGEGGVPIKCECRVATVTIDRASDNAQTVMANLQAAAAKPAVKPAPVASAPIPAPTPAPTPAVASEPAAKTVPAAPVPAQPAGKPAALAIGTPPKIKEQTTPAAAKPATGSGIAPTDWKSRIQAAIEREAFRLTYQPIVGLHADAAEYFEVLVRMVADNEKLIPAGQFMPRAAETGQSVAIDRWVVRQSIRALAELRRQERKVRFFINLSASALKDVELVVIAQQALHETGLKGKYVVFEIDETDIANNADPAMAFIRAASKIGCSICIDNFGRALSISNRLREAAIHYLKLDGGLLQNVNTDPVAQASLRAVVDVAKTMEKKTIAKSVESAEALSVLWTLGIDYVQGHYFQEADPELNYEFGGETTISSEAASPQWAVANSTKSH